MGDLSKPAILRPLKALEMLSQIELMEKNGRILTLSRAGHLMARKFRLGINELVIACVRRRARQITFQSVPWRLRAPCCYRSHWRNWRALRLLHE